MKQWNNGPYTLTISEESDPLYTLYYGNEVVSCTTIRNNETPKETCGRVINNYLRYKCYGHWLNIMALSGYNLDPHLEETWLEFMKSKFVVKLKILLAIAQEEIDE